MKFSKLFNYVVPATAVLFSVVGCTDFDNGFDAKSYEYQKQFEMQFGNIDPNQDWDLYGQLVKQREKGLATRAAADITVTDLGEAYYRKITSDDNKAYQKMLPESDNSSNPYSKTNLGRVTQNFSAYTTQLTLYPIHWNTGGSDVVGIYYYTDSSDSEATAVKGADGKTYYIVTKEVYSNKTHVDGVKETTAYAYVTACTDAHWNELVAAHPEKYLISDGTQKHQYGTAIPEGTKIIKSGKQKETYDGSGVYYDFYYRWNVDVDMSDLAADLMALHSNYAVADGTATYKDAYGNTIENGKLVELKTTYAYGGVNTYQDLSSAFADYTYLRSHPIQVSIPASVGKIGFYITNGSSGTKYSESKLNAKVTFSDEGESDACYVATYIDTDAEGKQVVDADGKPVRYLCFEDWMGSNTNFDLNDVVFRVYGLDDGGSSIVDDDETTEDALVVCEDLGDFDFDFNDVVFQVQYYSKESKTFTYDANGNVTSVTSNGTKTGLRFIPLAAGGVYESTIVFDYGTTVDGSSTVNISNGSSNEIHALLGGSAPSIINAGETFDGPGATIEVPSNKLPTTDKGTYPTLLSRFFAEGRFKIHVVNNNTNASLMTSSDSYKEKGVPQMMLLPTYFKWAREMTPIEQAYTNFTQWVSDATATGWINTYVSSKVTERYVENGGQSTPSVDPTPGTDPEPEVDPTPSTITCTVSEMEDGTTSWGSSVKNCKIQLPTGDISGKKLTVTLSNSGNTDFQYGGYVGTGTKISGGSTTTHEFTSTQLQNCTDGYLYVTFYTLDNSVVSAIVQ